MQTVSKSQRQRFWQRKVWTQRHLRGEKLRCKFLARESAKLFPNFSVLARKSENYFANFSATKVTSLPSVCCLSLSLSLSLCIIGSAEALPILCVRYSLGQWNWVADVTESQFDRAWSQKNAAQTPSDCGVGPEKKLFPCTRALRRWSMVYHRLLFSNDPSSSFLAHRLVVITHAIVKLRCKKETAENWQQST